MELINWKNSKSILEIVKTLKSLKKYERMYVSLRLILEDKDKGGYNFFCSNLGIKIFLKMR